MQITQPKMALFIVLVFFFGSVYLGYQSQNFEMDASADTLLVKDNKHYIRTQQANQKYAPEEFILVAFKPKAEDIYSAEVLNLLVEISNKFKQLGRVKSVTNITNVPLFAAGDISLSDSFNADDLSWQNARYNANTMRLTLQKHPLYEGLLVNPAHDALSMQIVFKNNPEISKLDKKIVSIQKKMLTGELSADQQNELDELTEQRKQISQQVDQTRSEEIRQIREILTPYQDKGEFYLGGANLLGHQLLKIISSDLVIFGSAIVIVVTLVLLVLFRSIRFALLPMLSCAVAVICTLGLLAILGLKVTVISANVIALQIILTLAVIIHILVQYQENSEQAKDINHAQLMQQTLRDKAKPCFYAALTTMIGFASLIFSGIQPVISFGYMMVIAMSVSLLISLVFFPAICSLVFNDKQKIVRHSLIHAFLTGLANASNRFSKSFILLGVGILAVSMIGALKLTAENSFLNYFDESTEVYQELTYIDQEFGGSTPFDLIYDLPEQQAKPDLIISAANAQQVQKLHDIMASDPAIGSVTSIADFLRIAQVVRGKPATEYEITALYNTLDDDLKNQIFNAYFSIDDQQIRISSRVKDSTEGLNREQLVADIKQKLADAGIAAEDYQLTNLFILYQDILSRLIDSQINTLGLVYLVMLVVLYLIFRSFRIALIALVPNLITTGAILGFMGFMEIPLDLMTLTIGAIAMGISVDDTIHYIHRYQHEMKQGSNDLIKSTNQTVGYALFYTTLVIVLGFFSLFFSDFVPSVLFGVLTGFAMILALLTDICILPAMLKKFVRAK
ncbi:efflux RND transporter permease subunit [Gayadomonas joobiniege]|uniref:efflux RND transporter permease subunit n=1 Tax=Gayadomonas joobiniege TaxID=1234606 RepID=UPI00036B588A|nr:MMPL family transporter [Gayadomonas joobiniege]